MSDNEFDDSIHTSGPPVVSGQGREVFSFHLHRYLSGWLRETGCERVLVTVGFVSSGAELGAYRVDRDGAHAVRSGWKHRDLEDAWRYGDGRLVWEAPSGESITFEVVAVYDEPVQDRELTSSDIIGFATVRSGAQLHEDAFGRLSGQVSEAIRVARRNSVRLFFEEQRDRPVKSLLYAMLNRLPEWSGCDHSAAVLLTHDLDAMTLEDSTRGSFDVLAERVFFGDDEEDPERLVGMSACARQQQASLLGDALLRHHDSSATGFIYQRHENSWRSFGGGDDGAVLSDWYDLEGRPEEQTVIFVPLTSSTDTEDQRDLLGFLTVAWSEDVQLPVSVRQVLDGVGRNLGRLLRQSSLYTLSVRKLWVARRVRDRIEEAIDGGEEGPETIERIIGEVSELVAEHVDVPSFAMGYLRGPSQRRTLRFAHPHGWTRYNDLDLEVDVVGEDRVDSGVSALAIRLQRPVVLAGGYGEGADQEFKNYLWVDEENNELFDAREVNRAVGQFEQRCRPLRDYYKPARESAYATLAYPMMFSHRPMGVLTVEVERSTDWLWWTGFGGHLFWDMIAREMAMGIYWLR